MQVLSSLAGVCDMSSHPWMLDQTMSSFKYPLSLFVNLQAHEQDQHGAYARL